MTKDQVAITLEALVEFIGARIGHRKWGIPENEERGIREYVKKRYSYADVKQQEHHVGRVKARVAEAREAMKAIQSTCQI